MEFRKNQLITDGKTTTTPAQLAAKMVDPSSQTVTYIDMSAWRPLTKEEKRKRNNFYQRGKHQALMDLGLKRVRGSLGGTYYE